MVTVIVLTNLFHIYKHYGKLRQIVALSVLDDEELRNHLTNFDIDDISDVQGWIDNHTRPGYWCDYSFLLSAANYLKRDFVIILTMIMKMMQEQSAWQPSIYQL